jgi:hypothetical protein
VNGMFTSATRGRAPAAAAGEGECAAMTFAARCLVSLR